MELNEHTSSQRIGYIDAMRGFTMILVVYSHVCGFCLGDSGRAFNDVLFLFRLPCFFFISGWLFCKTRREWSREEVRQVVLRKARVQLVPTFVFLMLLAPPPQFFHQLGATKGGYWFTFALFEFFLLYISSALLFRGRRAEVWQSVFALLVSAAAFFYDAAYSSLSPHMRLGASILGGLSFTTWRYYLFFYLGALVSNHFDGFLRLTSRRPVLVLSAVVFLSVVLMSPSQCASLAYVLFAFGGVSGVVLVFTFFRCRAHWFSADRFPGRCLQYVGCRTLDVYLLHYFFLPRFLLSCSVPALPLPVDVAFILLVSSVVVVLCLLVSRLLRLSPFLSYWLFGK